IARSLLALGRADEARPHAEALVEAGSTDVNLLLLAAEARVASLDKPGAREILITLQKSEARNAIVLRRVGDLYAALGDISDAIPITRKRCATAGCFSEDASNGDRRPTARARHPRRLPAARSEPEDGSAARAFTGEKQRRERLLRRGHYRRRDDEEQPASARHDPRALRESDDGGSCARHRDAASRRQAPGRR